MDWEQRERRGIFGPRSAAHLSSMNWISARWNQGLQVPNTNVTVSRNLYRSTLSALIAWDRAGTRERRQAIGLDLKGPRLSRARGLSLLHSSAAPARRQVSRIRSVPLHLHLLQPPINQRWPETRSPGPQMMRDMRRRDTERDGKARKEKKKKRQHVSAVMSPMGDRDRR